MSEKGRLGIDKLLGSMFEEQAELLKRQEELTSKLRIKQILCMPVILEKIIEKNEEFSKVEQFDESRKFEEYAVELLKSLGMEQFICGEGCKSGSDSTRYFLYWSAIYSFMAGVDVGATNGR